MKLKKAVAAAAVPPECCAVQDFESKPASRLEEGDKDRDGELNLDSRHDHHLFCDQMAACQNRWHYVSVCRRRSYTSWTREFCEFGRQAGKESLRNHPIRRIMAVEINKG